MTATPGESERNKVYLQEAVDGRERMQHDEEEKSTQADAGQHERPSWNKSTRRVIVTYNFSTTCDTYVTG